MLHETIITSLKRKKKGCGNEDENNAKDKYCKSGMDTKEGEEEKTLRRCPSLKDAGSQIAVLIVKLLCNNKGIMLSLAHLYLSVNLVVSLMSVLPHIPVLVWW